MLTKREAAIVAAYTGFIIGDFTEFHKYAEGLVGHPIWTHQFADENLMKEIHEKSKADFIALDVEK